MNPGRELDALISEKVMGIPVTEERGGFWPPALPGQNYSTQEIPEYSTNIRHAWEVVERLKNTHYNFQMENDQGELRAWIMRFGKAEAESESAPHAICLAALKVMETP